MVRPRARAVGRVPRALPEGAGGQSGGRRAAAGGGEGARDAGLWGQGRAAQSGGGAGRVPAGGEVGMDVTVARIVHVLSVVLWIGGVGFVTAVLFPAVRRTEPPERRLEAFGKFESLFGWQGRT